MRTLPLKASLLGAICALPLLIGASAAHAAIMTIDFDDLNHAPYDAGHLLPNGYHGFNWDHVGVFSSQLYSWPGSGVGPGTVSPPMIGYNWPGGSSFSANHTFTFLGGDFTSPWRNGMTVTLIGSLNGVLKYSTGFIPTTKAPTLENLNWSNIDKVTILAQGGVYAGYGGDGEQVVFDNLRVSTVPVPAALPMFLAALGGIWLMARRRLSGYRAA